MSYIIDGHNLIPKLPGLSLQSLDDEQELIKLLQDFCRLSRKQVEVYFDKAALGSPGAAQYGVVTVRFARHGQTADQAIAARLKKMGRSARNSTVVSSDLAVQNNARSVRASVMTSDEFAGFMLETLHAGSVTSDPRANLVPDSDEVEQWLEIFQAKKNKRRPK